MSFDLHRLERQYAYLDECPDHLLDRIATLSTSTLASRVAGLMHWRNALLRGELPGATDWPAEPIAEPVRAALSKLGVQRFCRGRPELVDALLDDVLDSFERMAEVYERKLAAKLDALIELERRRQASQSRARKPRRRRPRLTAEVLAELRARAQREVDVMPPDAELMAQWAEHVRLWHALADVFGDLGELLGRGWDMSIGVIRHTGWRDLVRLRALMEQLPQLRDIVESLGRMQARDDSGSSVASQILEPVSRVEQELRDVRTPHVPAEIRGVTRGGELARMLPSEAVMLGHPQLRWLWHARRAERALLLYRAEGVRLSTAEVEVQDEVPSTEARPRHERGPLIAVVDTSGSMHGTPERVAKALVLETVRVAHAERRSCLVYVYSGPAQVDELELTLSDEGVGALLEFLAWSFGGGNDEVGVLRRVLARVSEESWQNADILFVSDGEWPAPREIGPALAEFRESGGRVHGVQIGNHGRTGLHSVCDPVHEFRSWLALAAET